MRELRSSFESIETPFYYYDLDLLRNTLGEIKSEVEGFPYHIHFALKSNCNHRIIEIIKNHGFGADCVSGNEVKLALDTGFKKEEVVFAGVGKTDKELKYGLEQEIFSFNVESIQELEVLEELAGKMGKKAKFALRLNPNVDAGTHKYITTEKETTSLVSHLKS